MKRSQRLRTCCNLQQLADIARTPQAKMNYLAQLNLMRSRLKKKNDHSGSYPEMIAH